MGFESIVKRIESLPPLPESIQKMQALFAKGDIDITALVKIIESDPILTANLLAEANSPLYSFSKQIVSVSQAVTLFGATTIRGLLLQTAMKQSFKLNLEPYGLREQQFSEVSSLQSTLMFQWYMGIDMQKAQILTPLAFLLEMGKVVIANEIANSEYATLFRDELLESGAVDALERFYAEVSTAEVDAMLFEHWHFDEQFVAIMRDFEKSDTPYSEHVHALKVVQMAVNVVEQFTPSSIENAKTLASSYGYDSARFEKIVNRLLEKLQR